MYSQNSPESNNDFADNLRCVEQPIWCFLEQ